MNLKQFFKVSNKKLMLTLVLIILSAFFFFGVIVIPYPMSCVDVFSCRLSLAFFISGSFIFSFPLIISFYFGLWGATLLTFIAGIFYWYAVSCIINYLSRKLRIVLLIATLVVFLAAYLIMVQPSGANRFFSIKDKACEEVLNTNCSVNTSSVLVDFDVNRDGIQDESDNLQNLCVEYYGVDKETNTEYDCKRVCGCFGA
jgi:hypothetical protein